MRTTQLDFASYVHSVAFSPNGQILAVRSRPDALRRRILWASALLSTCLIAACSTTAQGSPQTSGVRPGSPESLSQTQAESALLPPGKVGSDFSRTPAQGSQHQRLPCSVRSAKSWEQETSPIVRANVSYQSSEQQDFYEEITSYSTVDAATAALALFVNGYGCATGNAYFADGTVGEGQLRIQPRSVDLNKIHATTADEWVVSIVDGQGNVSGEFTLFAAMTGSSIVTLSGAYTPGRTSFPSTQLIELLREAVERVDSAR